MDPLAPAAWRDLLRRQERAVSRAQLLAQGFTDAAINAQIAGGRWQRPLPGVVVTFTGPLPIPAICWAGLLYAGANSLLSHDTAGALWGLVPESRTTPLHVTIPFTRGVRSRRG